MTAEPMWTPSAERLAAARLTKFQQWLAAERGLEFDSYHDLWQWSVDDMGAFWTAWWDWRQPVAETRGARVLESGDHMWEARFFPDARLNFAENQMRRRDDGPALIFRNEVGDREEISWAELHRRVAALATAMTADGVGPGDRVAAYMPNIPETVVVALATIAIGATFASCAPDYGSAGVLDRLGQIEPTVLFAADGYHYNGKIFHAYDRLDGNPGRAARSAAHRACPLRRPACDAQWPAGGGLAGGLCLRARGGEGAVQSSARRHAALHPVLLRHHREAPNASSTAPAAA